MKLFSVTLFALAAAVVEKNETFPCPSETCWEYTAGTCSLKAGVDGCTRVTCGATEMLMEMSDNVFNDTDASMDLVLPALSETNMTDNPDALLRWTNTCALGDNAACGMTYKVNDAGKYVELTQRYEPRAGECSLQQDIMTSIIVSDHSQ